MCKAPMFSSHQKHHFTPVFNKQPWPLADGDKLIIIKIAFRKMSSASSQKIDFIFLLSTFSFPIKSIKYNSDTSCATSTFCRYDPDLYYKHIFDRLSINNIKWKECENYCKYWIVRYPGQTYPKQPFFFFFNKKEFS